MHCKCRNRLTDKIVEKCDEDIDGNKMVYNATFYDYEKVCNSCTLYTVLLITTFIIIMSIGSAYLYFYCHTKKIMI